MCDLIDLNSPDAKGSLNRTKLASPLIPVPKNVESVNVEADPLVVVQSEKRGENEGNNPFDRVLHETVEYVSKTGDPFEMMLERALKSKRRRNGDLRSVSFADDYSPRCRKRYLSRNKTLDGSLFEVKFDVSDEKVEVRKETDSLNVRNADVCDNNMTVKPASYKNDDEDVFVSNEISKIVVTGPESLESSILNQSAMNDTLLETVPKKGDDISFILGKDTLLKDFLCPSSNTVKSRSLSQGAVKSPTMLSCLSRRSQSVTDDEKKILQHNDYSSIPSFLDKGFLESKYNEQSVLSTLSNVSSIAKLSSISISSSALSIDNMNHAFLDSFNSLKMSRETVNTTENSVEIKSKQYDLSDLAEKLEKLKCAMNGTTSTLNKIEDKCIFTKEENEEITNDKLIDVDVFLPEEDSNKEYNKTSSSTASLDSAFTSSNKINKSIIDEAKMLSKTFEELALRTDSGSSVDDDLISNNTLWMSELLPAFEDDLVVDNLIELPVSPEESPKGIKNNDKEQSFTSIGNVEENPLKEMEPQFTDCVKQTVVTSLLADLRKLVKAEDSPEVNKLLDNLENVLDSNCKNNTELLVACLNLSTELRSPQKVSSDIEKSEVTNTDKSEEESGKISFKEDTCNPEKLLSDTSCKLEDSSQATTGSSGNLSVKPSSYKDNDEENHPSVTNLSDKETHTNCAKENDNQLDEKMALELLMNLGKLLSGQVEDAMTMQLLKRIGKALNVASNNYQIESEMQLDSNKMQSIQQITSIEAAESDCNAHFTVSSTKTEHRRSFERQSKLHEKTARRSVTVINSSPRSASNTQTYKYRRTSEFEDRKKRFSNDGLVRNLANKKMAIPETMKKEEVQSGTKKEEKSIAISDVKNKLKKRTDVVNKRGPMKAVHPVDNMQKKGALFGKQTTPSSQTVTPPKSDKSTPSGKIISSTPNSMDGKCYIAKKSARSKPVASSTPDGQNSKVSSTQLTCANKKRNLSCDISPVTAYVNMNMNGSDERKESPKRLSKLPTPKKCTTPKTNKFDIPKFLTPPRRSSNYQRSPQRLNRSLMERQRYSPLGQKKSAEKILHSPLKENRITAKVKPLNLISKLKQHATGDSVDKENSYA